MLEKANVRISNVDFIALLFEWPEMQAIVPFYRKVTQVRKGPFDQGRAYSSVYTL